ncbi:MAG: hypothetical protein DMG61_02955 [Acidobacteria bacterium]|nr:MAG: hypothetical protein DMG61_02955 [Acidobacteriota bacterium]
MRRRKLPSSSATEAALLLLLTSLVIWPRVLGSLATVASVSVQSHLPTICRFSRLGPMIPATRMFSRNSFRGLTQPDDVAFAISCSGNSRNVLKALEVAREAGAVTIGLGGFEGGFMKSLCDRALIISSDNMQIIEDLHLSVAHCLFTLVRNQILQEDFKKVVAARAS